MRWASHRHIDSGYPRLGSFFPTRQEYIHLKKTRDLRQNRAPTFQHHRTPDPLSDIPHLLRPAGTERLHPQAARTSSDRPIRLRIHSRLRFRNRRAWVRAPGPRFSSFLNRRRTPWRSRPRGEVSSYLPSIAIATHRWVWRSTSRFRLRKREAAICAQVPCAIHVGASARLHRFIKR